MGRLTHCGEGAGDCLLGGLPSTRVDIERAEEEEEEEVAILCFLICLRCLLIMQTVFDNNVEIFLPQFQFKW